MSRLSPLPALLSCCDPCLRFFFRQGHALLSTPMIPCILLLFTRLFLSLVVCTRVCLGEIPIHEVQYGKQALPFVEGSETATISYSGQVNPRCLPLVPSTVLAQYAVQFGPDVRVSEREADGPAQGGGDAALGMRAPEAPQIAMLPPSCGVMGALSVSPSAHVHVEEAPRLGEDVEQHAGAAGDEQAQDELAGNEAAEGAATWQPEQEEAGGGGTAGTCEAAHSTATPQHS